MRTKKNQQQTRTTRSRKTTSTAHRTTNNQNYENEYGTELAPKTHRRTRATRTHAKRKTSNKK